MRLRSHRKSGLRLQPSGGRRGTVFCLLLLVFLSCAHPPRIYLRPQTDLSDFKKIAVLPFDNLSGEEGAGEKMTEIFIIELLRNGKFSVAEPGRVKKAVVENRLRSGEDHLTFTAGTPGCL